LNVALGHNFSTSNVIIEIFYPIERGVMKSDLVQGCMAIPDGSGAIDLGWPSARKHASGRV
jgi:hypothetical protein